MGHGEGCEAHGENAGKEIRGSDEVPGRCFDVDVCFHDV
jgi:hypothetical protein